MKYILDSSVGLKFVLSEKDSDKALNLLDGGHSLLAPDVYCTEVAHVLSKLFRQGHLTERQARENYIDLLDTRPALKLTTRLLPEAWEISLRTRCSIYDALYVALAEREQCEMITADEKLVNNLKARRQNAFSAWSPPRLVKDSTPRCSDSKPLFLSNWLLSSQITSGFTRP